MKNKFSKGDLVKYERDNEIYYGVVMGFELKDAPHGGPSYLYYINYGWSRPLLYADEEWLTLVDKETLEKWGYPV